MRNTACVCVFVRDVSVCACCCCMESDVFYVKPRSPSAIRSDFDNCPSRAIT